MNGLSPITLSAPVMFALVGVPAPGYYLPTDLPDNEPELTEEQSLFLSDPGMTAEEEDAEEWVRQQVFLQERREREARMHFAELQDEERGNYYSEI